MGAGESGEHELAGIGVARIDGQLVAMLEGADDLVDVVDLQGRVDALGEHIQGQSDDVDVAGALAVAEERALDALGAGHQRQLGGGHAGATVVVRDGC